jgi:hypothetical protein
VVEKKVPSIPTYKELNDEITTARGNITNLHESRNQQNDDDNSDVEQPEKSTDMSIGREEEPSSQDYQEFDNNNDDTNHRLSSIGTVLSYTNNVLSKEDGVPQEAAFVSFEDLTSANLALHAVHHHTPFVLRAEPAP